MSDSLVTILIPVYNVEAYLPQCLDSVTGQTYKHLQIVAIDDGSSDGSWDILRKYASRDDRIEIYHQENQGVAATRNNLLEKIKGEYVLFVDSDDWMELCMVEFLLAEIQHSNADLAICGNVINDASVSLDFSRLKCDKRYLVREFLRHDSVRGSLWNKFIKATLLVEMSFDPTISYGEDALFCWHFFQNVDTVIITNRQLYHYRMVDTSLSHYSFSPAKMSAHYAWSQICDETVSLWPDFIQIAKARHCIEDVLLLRDAIKNGYSDKDNLRLLQLTIKTLSHTLDKVEFTSWWMRLYAKLLGFAPCCAKF